ncbi:MAG: helix-turn-helix domain-containing protein [Actinomycetota bacterium]|nr:helix-turn-helix domain-containing protein [Actinomycetota bacterium]
MVGNDASVGVGAVEMVLGRPSAALSPYVERYIGYRQDPLAGGTHQGLPSRCMALILSLAEPVRILSMPDPASVPQAFAGLISGLHPGPVTIAADQRQFGIHVELTPWAAGALLGHPAGVLAGGVYDVPDVLGGQGGQLLDRVREAPDWSSRFAVLDDVLGTRADCGWAPQPEVSEAWRALVRTGGRVPVARLARHVGWSRRHLGERFRREIGLSPKTAARVIRFDRSHTALTRSATTGLAEIAAACGYADQAHLTREWRALAGATPTAWMAAELPFVQDAAPRPRASCVHG